MTAFRYLYLISVSLIIWGCDDSLNKYNFEDFELSFPEDPIQEVKEESARQKTIIKSKGADDFNLLYEISYIDYDDNLYHSDSLHNLKFDLNYHQKSFVKKLGLTVTDMSPTSIKGYPAQHFRYITADRSKRIRTLVVFVKNRVYQLRVDTKVDLTHNKWITQFFDSFRLTSVGANKKPHLNLPTEKELNKPPFSIDFKSPTKRKIEIKETIYGDVALIGEVSEPKTRFDQTASQMVFYSKILKKDINPKEIDLINQQLISENRQGGASWEIISNEPITFKGFKGSKRFSEMTFSGEKIHMVSIHFIDSRKIYFALGGVYLGDEVPKSINTFFDSFQAK